MRIPALALFERSLRLDSRSAVIAWSRAGLLAVMLLFLFTVQSMSRRGAPGLYFFEQITWINLIFISLAGLSYFASAITEEKEEMMLGLLRMTDLNPVAILLGKSTTRLIGALLLLLAQIPFVLLAVTLGGVGLVQIAAAYTTLLAYLFFLCNLALVFSVVFRNTASAAAITLLVLLVFFIGPYLASAIEQAVGTYYHINLEHGIWPTITTALDLWRAATPPERFDAIFSIGFSGPIFSFQVASSLVGGVLLFFLAWVLFDICTRSEKDATTERRWFWQRRSRRSRIPNGLVGFGAITWKDFTFLGGGKGGLVLKFGVVGLVVAICNLGYLWSDEHPNLEFEATALMTVSLWATVIWLAVDASRIFREEIRGKTLSSLMTLPISVRGLAYRKVAGALMGTLPLLSGYCLGALVEPHRVGRFFDEASANPGAWGSLIVMVLQYVLLLHLIAFLSLILKRGALPLALGIQYVGGGFFMFFFMFLFAGAGVAGGYVLMFITGFICIALTIVLHLAIGARLEHAAAQE